MSSKSTSSIWVYFTKQGQTATCTFCQKNFKNSSSTGVLWRHLKSQHLTNISQTFISDDNLNNSTKKRPKITNEREEEVLLLASESDPETHDTESTLSSNSSTSLKEHVSQPKISSIFSTPGQIRKKSEKITQLIVEMVATDMLPLNFVENDGFRNLIKFLEPSYQIPHRTTILRRLKLLYFEQKEKLKKELEESEHIALTTDTWTSRNSKSYITVTAHMVTNDWTLKSVNLSTSEMSERHTSENLCEKIFNILKDWNIERKICATVHDNAANVTKCVTENRQKFGDSVPCFAHTLQLCLNAGLEASENIKLLLKTASNIVSHFHHSNVSSEALKLRQKQLNVPEHRLIQRVKTRWNSAFYMLKRLAEQRQPVSAVLIDRSIVNAKSIPSLTLSEDQWIMMERLIQVLEPFEKATTLLSAEKSVTLSMAKPLMNTLLENFLKETPDDTDDSIQIFKTTVSQEIKERFFYNIDKENLTVFDTTSLMDLRYINDIPTNIKQLGTKYLEMLTSKISVDNNELTTEDKEDAEQVRSALDYLFPKVPQESLSEVALYVKEHVQDKRCSPLKWWKENYRRYPKLSKLAKKYLCIPATSTPSERVFSTAGNIISAKRSCLASENVELLVFLYENLKTSRK